jgi:hypothetical protein
MTAELRDKLTVVVGAILAALDPSAESGPVRAVCCAPRHRTCEVSSCVIRATKV